MNLTSKTAGKEATSLSFEEKTEKMRQHYLKGMQPGTAEYTLGLMKMAEDIQNIGYLESQNGNILAISQRMETMNIYSHLRNEHTAKIKNEEHIYHLLMLNPAANFMGMDLPAMTGGLTLGIIIGYLLHMNETNMIILSLCISLLSGFIMGRLSKITKEKAFEKIKAQLIKETLERHQTAVEYTQQPTD